MKSSVRYATIKVEPLNFSEELARAVLDSLSTHIAILDANGVILETNSAWRIFSMNSGIPKDFDYKGVNYLDICDATTGEDTDIARKLAEGIRAVIAGKIEEFLLKGKQANLRSYLLSIS
ncbi:MAG: hypothetical protein JSV31_06270 [Desulfobacterales bacterium]|nr:MAG: hypothetical protein JSV31_06270 [Desulfobacterales bacterium]